MKNSKLIWYKNKIRQCFNRSALTYDQYSYPQQMIGAKLLDHVCGYIKQAELIADLGCGTGLITKQLISILNFKKLYALDISDEFIHIANKRLSYNNVFICHDDFDNLTQYNQLFNLVFSNMALHWSDDIYKTLLFINKNMVVNGMIVFTIPLEGTFCELASSSRNHFYKLDDISIHLVNLGFELIKCFEETFIFGFNSWIKAIKSVKATGANYLFHRGKNNLANNVFSNSNFHLKNNFIQSPSLTYQVGYLIGKKQHVY